MSKIALIGLTLVMANQLRADSLATPEAPSAKESPQLIKHLESLKRMESDRKLDTEHTLQARKEFSNSTAELSGYDVQHLSDVQHLRVAENQVAAGIMQRNQAQQSYKDSVKAFGSDDPRSSAAKENWKQSKQAMEPLLLSRQQLKESVHEGGRLVHNDKTVLSFQKRTMASDARYRASDDRKILNEERHIADDRSAMLENAKSIETPQLADISNTVGK